jgi:hypothetical protein
VGSSTTARRSTPTTWYFNVKRGTRRLSAFNPPLSNPTVHGAKEDRRPHGRHSSLPQPTPVLPLLALTNIRIKSKAWCE